MPAVEDMEVDRMEEANESSRARSYAAGYRQSKYNSSSSCTKTSLDMDQQSYFSSEERNPSGLRNAGSKSGKQLEADTRRIRGWPVTAWLCRFGRMPSSDALEGKPLWKSEPPPPQPNLWDTDDAAYLDKICCKARIRVTMVDPKNSRFELRMTCEWKFRTLNNEDRTEIRLRVPGIRMPGLLVTVDESRIWRDLKLSTSKSIFWRGLSLFTFTGFEIFEMRDFPFDRQLINLELFDFVWRPDKDAATHDFLMKVVHFSVETSSMLPEWGTYKAIVSALNHTTHETGPSNASRFSVSLRLERQSWYYIVQIFLVTFMITVVSCFPLAMPPTEQHVGDRLSLYGSGLLTLVAFKYGISDHLPKVPYSTYTDWYLLFQLITLACLSLETLVAYRFKHHSVEIDIVENYLLGFLICVWLMYFGHSCRRRPKTWQHIVESQEQVRQMEADSDDEW